MFLAPAISAWEREQVLKLGKGGRSVVEHAVVCIHEGLLGSILAPLAEKCTDSSPDEGQPGTRWKAAAAEVAIELAGANK